MLRDRERPRDLTAAPRTRGELDQVALQSTQHAVRLGSLEQVVVRLEIGLLFQQIDELAAELAQLAQEAIEVVPRGDAAIEVAPILARRRQQEDVHVHLLGDLCQHAQERRG